MVKAKMKLAQKIIDQLGTIEKTELGEAWEVKVPQLGFMHTAVNIKTEKRPDTDRDGKPIKGGHVEVVDRGVKTTKKEASAIAASVLADQLNDGSILLSEDWETVNLKS